MKRIYIGCNYDSSDCTQSGYDISIMRDKAEYYRVCAEHNTRWQGRRSGEEYRDAEQHDTIEEAREDAKSLLRALRDSDSYLDASEGLQAWECIKPGYIIR